MPQITISNYILERLAQVGVRSIFGVPGDFNLAFLDFIDDHSSIEWRGCTNELNAAYAADGYSRTSKTLGVICTTFGVGELSAINGIAGAYAERIPVLHIVGVPSTALQKNKVILHHTCGDGLFDTYMKMSEKISSAVENLTSLENAAKQIDHVIGTALKTCRPTYLAFPTDFVFQDISDQGLASPLDWSLPKVPAKSQELLINQIVNLVKSAKNPIVVIDACASRFGIRDLCRDFIEKTGFTFYATPMGKATIDETHPQYGGLYVGSLSLPAVCKSVQRADLILSIGALDSDINTGGFSQYATTDQVIKLHSDHTSIQYAHYKNAGFHSILPKLTSALKPLRFEIRESSELTPVSEDTPPQSPNSARTGPLTHDGFWALWEQFFRDGDVIIGETGTPYFGLYDVKFPRNAIWISQILYGSIGFTTGASFGAAIAVKDATKRNRTLLFIGDGSLQFTVQELSNVIKHNLPVTVILLNNSGFTTERLIRGKERQYNDIAEWSWQRLFDVFGYDMSHQYYHRVETFEELHKLHANDTFFKNSFEKPQLVEVILDKLDAPRVLYEQALRVSKANDS